MFLCLKTFVFMSYKKSHITVALLYINANQQLAF